MLGSMAAPPLLPLGEAVKSPSGITLDPVQEKLFTDYRIEVPVVSWPAAGRRLVRVSAQAYNSLGDYEVLAQALREIIAS
jgi:isopenicillin-N epimerase